MKKNDVVAIIIARAGSKSIPRKNLLKIRGKPLVAWPILLAKSTKKIGRVIVTTDDLEIMEVAKKFGAETPFLRPKTLADDETPTLPVLQHCLKYLKKKENYTPKIVALLYPTSPFLSKKRVEEALDLFDKYDCNSVISVVRDWGRFWKQSGDGTYKPFYPLKRVNRQYFQPLLRENGAIYFSKFEVLMGMNKLVDKRNIQFVIMKGDENIDIDFISDLKKAKTKQKVK